MATPARPRIVLGPGGQGATPTRLLSRALDQRARHLHALTGIHPLDWNIPAKIERVTEAARLN